MTVMEQKFQGLIILLYGMTKGAKQLRKSAEGRKRSTFECLLGTILLGEL
jgi:hypothetical protein